MSLHTRNIWAARAHLRRGTALNACGRGVSSSILPNEDLAHEGRPKKHSNPLLHVQTHTGVRNMAHGLHIIRNIETKYGVIESFLFPRESGTNEYHPTFFFRFREPKAIRQLAKPYTHLDIPVLELEDKPNHEIGMNDVGYLVSPNSSEFFPTHVPEATETGDPVENLPEEDATSSSPNKPSTLKSRYAIRIAVSGLDEYPQPFFSHKTINVHERARIERELAGWKGAYETLESASSSSQPQAHLKAQSIEELLQENFNVPQNTLVLPQTKHKKELVLEGDSISEQPEPEQPPQATEYQLFRVHSRRDARSTSRDLLPDSDVGAGEIAEGGSPIKGAVADDTPATGSSVQSNPRVSAKRERQLEQMRRAAASQVRLIAEKRQIDEEAAKRAKAASEAGTDDHLPASNQGRSLWDRFLGR